MRKKRLVLVCFLIALIVVTLIYGYWAGALVLALFIAGLCIVKAKDLFLSRRGTQELEGLRPKFGYEIAIARVRETSQRDDAFKFVVLGDTRKRMKMATQIFEQSKTEDPAVIFHTGDIVRGGKPSDFMTAFVPLLELAAPIPVLSVPGNHERGPWRDFAAYRALCGDDRFAFEAGGCLFIGLNNSTRDGVRDSDLAFLNEKLSATAALHRFVFIHIPPAFFEAKVVNDSQRRGFVKNAPEFHQLAVKHHVDEVFMAHIHGYVSAEIDGVRYTITAGAGAALSDRMPEFGRYHHYLVREVRGDTVRREIVRLRDRKWDRSEG